MTMAEKDVIRAGAMSCQSTQELILQDKLAFYGNQMKTEMDMPQSLKSILEKTTERAVKESRERTAEELFAHLEPVASAEEGSDLGTTEDPFEPTARCINDTKKRQLVTRSGLPRPRCCVCHLHRKWAMQSPAAFREFSKQCFNKCVTLRLMSLREMPTLQHSSTTKNKSTKICTIPQLPSC